MWFQGSDAADPSHVALVAEALSRSSARCGPVRVLALDGPSGSGKTTLAAALGEHLSAPVVHMEHLYPGWDGLAAAVPLLVDRVLAPLARGERAAYPVWDWTRDAWAGTEPVPPSPVLIIEGCGSSVGAAGEYAAVRVWVEAPKAVRQARGLARDGETYRPHWGRWAAQEARLFAADGTRDRADLVLVTG